MAASSLQYSIGMKAVKDKVLSKDKETGEVAYKEVTATFNHETDEITRFMWATK